MTDVTAAHQVIAMATRLNTTRFPDHTWVSDIDDYAIKAENAAALNRQRGAAGTVSYAALLESEVLKALAQPDRRRMRGALATVAAMALRRVAEIDLALEHETGSVYPSTYELGVAMDKPSGSP